jgi:hypothetical protein
MVRLLWVATAATAVLLAVPAATRATVLVEVPLEDMAVDADGIVLGRVVDVGVQMVFIGGRMQPWTVNTIEVERWIKSSGTGERTVRVYERGGEWQGGGMRIEGTPEYRRGERVVVFLERDVHGRLRTYGMVQGKYVVRAAVDGETTVERDLSGVAFARWARGQMTVEEPPPPETMPLADLLSRAVGAIRAVTPEALAPGAGEVAP